MKNSSGLTRRALIAAPLLVPAAALGSDARVAANRRIAVGVVGTGRQGLALIARLVREPDVQVAAVCEVDRTRRDNA
jgi:predicted homoserine dehydrogenase-like protein